ncbi:MAG: serine hydrolase [Bacteroidota bacterium]
MLIAEKKKIVFESSHGYFDIDRQLKHTRLSQFPIASVSKTFTATAILQLNEKGRLQLDDLVIVYLPDFPYGDITIRHLLSNTSGLTDYYVMFDSLLKADSSRIITNKDIIPAFIQQQIKTRFKPGERWDYNNLNFCVLALIVEKITGQSFSDYLQQSIFLPAGMRDSYLPVDRRVRENTVATLYGYRNTYTEQLENVDSLTAPFLSYTRSNFYGNGGIISTTSDLYKFDQALYANKLLSKESLDKAFTPARLNSGAVAGYKLDDREVSYGLGWEIFTDTSMGKIVFHDGSIPGLTSILVRNLSRQQTIIILDNTGSSKIFATSNAMVQLLNYQPYQQPGKSLARSYGSLLVKGLTSNAASLLTNYLEHKNSYEASEREFIRMGYELLRSNQTSASLHTFESATRLFPDSWNAFDSYGEALMQSGKKQEAIDAYKKSLVLNPGNDHAKKALEGL